MKTMKNTIKTILSLAFAIGIGVNVSAQAPTPTRVWNGEPSNAGDQNGYWLDPTDDNTYRLASTITVKNNLTLVVKDRAINIRIKGNNSAGAIFDVQDGGNLKIYGAEGKRVTLTGGVTFSNRPNAAGHYKRIEDYTQRGSYPYKGTNENVGNSDPLILCAGGLILDYVTLTNNFNTRSGDGDGAFTHDGGAIHLYNGTAEGNTKKITLTNVSIQNCHSENSGGAIHVHGKFSKKIDMTNCKIIKCSTRNPSDVQSGGIIRTNGGTNATLIMNNCEAYQNYTHNVGGVMWWNAYGNAGGETSGSATITGNCYFHDNVAYNDGGAIFNAGADLVVQSCKIERNKALQGVGGGIYCRNYVLTGNGQGNLTLGSNCEICSNDAPNGGGVALGLEEVDRTKYTVNSLTMTLNINGAYIHDNTASQNGAGIYMFKPDNLPAADASKYNNYFHLTSGTIEKNIAKGNGGGVCIVGGVAENTMSNGSIISNKAQNGGGMYVGGGTSVVNGGEFSQNDATSGNGGCFCITSGNININGGTLSQNTAKINGGAIYVSGGKAAISNGILSGNSAGYNNSYGNGGGLYVADGEVDFIGGKVSTNYALSGNGGGAFVSGGIVAFSGGNLEKNQALNGAGVYLSSGADMTFTDGLIAGNKALGNGNAITTAYNAKNASIPVNGCGGGIYLESGISGNATVLSILVENSFGLYSNTAARAGDDIVAEGVFTQVKVPNVESMDLKDFEGKDAQPNWYEDYVYPNAGGDTQYAEYSILKYTGGSGKRFKDMIEDGTGDFYNHLVTFTDQYRTYPTASGNDGYVCLSLGYKVISVIIQATNLDNKENIYFTLEQLIKPDGATEWEVKNTYPVLVKGNGSETVQRIVRNLMPGTYRVKQAQIGGNDPWAWSYSVTSPTSGILEKLVTVEDGEHNLFPFTLQHVTGDDSVLHDEEIKSNQFVKE